MCFVQSSSATLMRLNPRLFRLFFRCLSVSGLIISFLAATPATGLSQRSGQADHPSHRTLAPDAAKIQELMARARLLRRLQDFVGQRNQLPGVADPEQQQRLKQIMQQMTMSLAESGIQLPGQGRGRSGQNNRTTRSDRRTPVEFSSNGNREEIQRYLESISGRLFENTDHSREIPNLFPDDTQSAFTGELPDTDSSTFEPPDSRMSGEPHGSSPFDDVSEPGLSLTDRLTRIADRARVDSLGSNESRNASLIPSGSGWFNRAGIQAAIETAIDGAADRVAERASGSTADQAGTQGSRDRLPDTATGLHALERTAEWIGDFANRATTASEQAHESMVTGPSDSTSTVSAFNGSWLIFPLLVLAAAGTVAWSLQRRRITSQSGADPQHAGSLPRSIRTRQDILSAFHFLATADPAVGADWWTHRRAARAMVQANPETRAAVESLVQVYEQARYCPDSALLSESQIETVIQAIRRIGRS